MEVIAEPGRIDFGASGVAEILQNVRTILTTITGTAPFSRDLGVAPDPIDGPLEIAKARLTPLIIEAVQTYEPRVEVTEVTYMQDDQGQLTPSVKLKLLEGVTA